MSADEDEDLQKSKLIGRHVAFDKKVRVAMLPQEQQLDAFRARKGLWKPGPLHDELWDGDLGDFREVELSTEQFKDLARSKRTSLPKNVNRFIQLMSSATERLGKKGVTGVDTVGARARLSVDFDADMDEDHSLDDSHPIERRSSSQSGRVSYQDYVAEGSAPPSPKRNGSSSGETRRKHETHFLASPPSEPKPLPVTASFSIENMAAEGIKTSQNETWNLPRASPKHTDGGAFVITSTMFLGGAASAFFVVLFAPLVYRWFGILSSFFFIGFVLAVFGIWVATLQQQQAGKKKR